MQNSLTDQGCKFSSLSNTNFISSSQVVFFDTRQILENFTINQKDNSRFYYRICLQKEIFSNLASIYSLIYQIEKSTNIQHIELDQQQRVPASHLFFTLNAFDHSTQKLSHFLYFILKKLYNVQKQKNVVHHYKLLVLVPKMLVPTVIGKSGMTIKRIKQDSSCNITVLGPYSKYFFQQVGIQSKLIQSLVKGCNLVYEQSFKELKRNPLQFIQVSSQEPTIRQVYVQILLSEAISIQIIEGFKKYLNHLATDLKISQSASSKTYFRKENFTLLAMKGNLPQLKVYLSSILQLIFFQNLEKRSVKFRILEKQAQNLTTFRGKLIRDISSKSNYCSLDIVTNGNDYLLIVDGDTNAKIKASCMILQFFAFTSHILRKKNELQLQQDKIKQVEIMYEIEIYRIFKNQQKSFLKSEGLRKVNNSCFQGE